MSAGPKTPRRRKQEMRRFALAAVFAASTAVSAHAADLTVWGLQAFNQDADNYIGQMVQDFGKSKGIDAQYVVVPATVLNDRLAAAFQGGAPPDAYMQVSQQAQYYIANNLVVPLDDVLAEVRKVPGGYAEDQIVVGKDGDHYAALPLEVDVAPLFARTDLLKEINKGVPATWDELREDAKLIQQKNPQISGFGLPVSNTNDAEGNMRNVIWSFGGKMMAEDGKTVTFDSPETRAAYQFVADMFLKDRTIPRSALTWDDSGNNIAYQTGRAAFIINPPSVWYWLKDNDQKLLANTEMASIPKGPGSNGKIGNGLSSWVWQVSKASKHQDYAKDWLRYFFQPEHYRVVIEKVGGRWAPVYPQMFDTIPLFSQNPAFKNFKTLSTEGFMDGYAGPPNALSGKVNDAKIVTKVLQKVLVDRTPVDQAVSWGQQQIEALGKGS
jgi:multiple sugar transport system substrate-binding protein